MIADEYFADVASMSSSSKTAIVPNGETWEVQTFQGSAAYSQDAHVCLAWDFGGAGEEVIYSTHGDGQFSGDRQFSGDGTKKLAICLVNDTGSSQILGGSFIAKKVA